MAFVKNDNIISVGDTVMTTKKISAAAGYFEKGSKVMVIGITERGYDIADEFGNKVLECGWSCVRKCNERNKKY